MREREMGEWESNGEELRTTAKVENVMGKNESNLKNGAAEVETIEHKTSSQTFLSP